MLVIALTPTSRPAERRSCWPSFFRAALERKVISVPGVFFDVNPRRRHACSFSRFHQRVRLSFGPPLAEVEHGLAAIAQIIDEAGAATHRPELAELAVR